MKKVLALAISLLMPVVPVFAQTTPDPTKQSAEAGAKMTTSSNQIAKDLQPASPDSPVAAGGPVTTPGTGPAADVKTPETQPAAKKVDTDPAVNANIVDEKTAAKKPSMFANMKAKLMGFVFKHPVVAGALVGAMLGAFGGPAGMVVGACFGAVIADVAHFYLKKK